MLKTARGTACFLLLLTAGCGAAMVQKADSRLAAGKYQEAAALYADYLEKHPGAALTRRKYALALLKDHRPAEAVVQFKTILDDHLHGPTSLLYLGLAYLELGEYRKTLSVWADYEARGNSFLAREIAKQSERLAAALPEVSAEMAGEMEAAIEAAIRAHHWRQASNASRLEGCGGG